MGDFGGDINVNDVVENDLDSNFLLENFENTTFKESSFFEDLEKDSNKEEKKDGNKSNNNNNLNVSALCCDEEISGYDKITGRTWIYPTNYPVRDYQFNIIKATLLKNTLVSLPTGLGKTFIAAVIMYNFYRWYPLGKIIFTAPTRPLVAQQIEACYNIIAIPPKDTIEMTGHMQVKTRKAHWMTKRVFFATPQVIYNDIKSGICPSDLIRCLVIDEAHRARGNYAYCKIVSTLTEMGHKTYRLLALSATPGSKVDDVITVVKNLHIANLELRTENCIDVAQYRHSREISSVIVELGPELTQLQQQYVEILDGYTRRLKQFNILPQNIGNLSKGRIVMMYKEFQSREKAARHPQHKYIMKDFTILIALYHGLELLVKHGSRVFLNFFDEHPEKSWIQSDDRLIALLERLRDDLGVNPLSLDRSMLPDGTVPEMPKDLRFGHPKFSKLKEIMLEHFEKAKREGQDTKAIIFCEYRESVNLVHCLLLQCRPLILPQMFVGQGASGKDGKTVVSQKQQLHVMRGFREGVSNTLVATCVAEEGLDVGSVDLIICFDMSTRSPIRLVQRCGRTGRERGGKVFILVTEGREHQTLVDCMRQRDGLNKKILQSKEVENNLYELNPRMVPRDFMPACQKMYITVAQKPDPKEKAKKSVGKKKKGPKDLRKMLVGRPSMSSNTIDEGDLTEEELTEIPNRFSSRDSTHKPNELKCLSKDSNQEIVHAKESDNAIPGLRGQRSLQQSVDISNLIDTEGLVGDLQCAKRLPSTTQNPDFKTQKPVTPKKSKNKKKKSPTKTQNKIDGDIRSLFSGSTKSIKNYTKSLKDLGLQDGVHLPMNFINLFVDINLESKNITKKCLICTNIFDCSLLQNIKKSTLSTSTLKRKIILDVGEELKLPDIELLNFVDIDTFSRYNTSLKKMNDNINTCDLSIEKNMVDEKSISHCPNDSDEITSRACESKDDEALKSENFNIGNIEDIFADSSPEILEEMNEQNVSENTDKNSSNPKETLGFFGLDSIEDIFADYSNSSDNGEAKNTEIVDNENRRSPLRPASPSILSGQRQIEIPKSPILCSQFSKNRSAKKTPLKDNSTPISAKKLPKMNLTTDSSVIDESNHEKLEIGVNQSNISSDNKSMFTVTQLVEMINRSDCDTSATKSTKIIENVKTEDVKNKIISSPILFTQAEQSRISNGFVENKKATVCANAKEIDLIIIDSDSESDENTQECNVDDDNLRSFTERDKEIEKRHIINSETKLNTEQNVTSSSPYFTNKQKSQDTSDKPLTLQEKVLAALISNKINFSKLNNSNNIYCSISFPSPTSLSKKENFRKFPNKHKSSDDEKDENDLEINSIQQLQKFRKDDQSHKVSKDGTDAVKARLNTKRKLSFSESDDDFMEPVSYFKNKSILNKSRNETNHKARKKRRKKNQFLDEEAELSGDGKDSGDELSDYSIGSIADFICDDNVSHTESDIHAFYLKSVKSPVKPGTFKIPQLNKKYSKAEVLSQLDEEQDSYEMDSFCVGSQVGLTQTTDETELERAEKFLEEKRRRNEKNGFSKTDKIDSNKESPIVKRKKQNVRRIQSDSDDSS